jgi:uncharacterized membrane protein YccC
VEPRYLLVMSLFLNSLFRYAARRIAFDPRARETALRAVRGVAGEARLIAGEKDRARAAGRSLRRALNRLQHEREEPEGDEPESNIR